MNYYAVGGLNLHVHLMEHSLEDEQVVLLSHGLYVELLNSSDSISNKL